MPIEVDESSFSALPGPVWRVLSAADMTSIRLIGYFCATLSGLLYIEESHQTTDAPHQVRRGYVVTFLTDVKKARDHQGWRFYTEEGDAKYFIADGYDALDLFSPNGYFFGKKGETFGFWLDDMPVQRKDAA